MIRPHNLSKGKTLALVAIFLILTLVGIGLLFSYQLNSSQPIPPQTSITPGPITVEGTIVCLPHKNTSGPQTLECAFGLQSKTGDYYGLTGLEQEQLMNGTLTVSTKVRIFGEVVAPEESERYGVVGNIDVKTIEVLQVTT